VDELEIENGILQMLDEEGGNRVTTNFTSN
jgi:hypothetical protein